MEQIGPHEGQTFIITQIAIELKSINNKYCQWILNIMDVYVICVLWLSFTVFNINYGSFSEELCDFCEMRETESIGDAIVGCATWNNKFKFPSNIIPTFPISW